MAQRTFDLVFNAQGINKVDKAFSSIDDSQKAMVGNQKMMNGLLIIEEGIVANILRLIQTSVAWLAAKMAGLGGGKFAAPFQAMGVALGRARKQGMGLFGSLGRGLNAFRGKAIGVFGGIGKMAAALGLSLGPFLAVIAGVIAAVYLLKKAWDNNVGGIQTRFSQAMGKMKDLWGKFEMAVNKFMQDIGPIMKPIIDILFFLGDKVLKLVIFQFKLLGFMIKVALIPFRVMIKAFKILYAVGKKVIGKFMKLKIVQKYVSAMQKSWQKVKNTVKAVWNFIKPIVDAIMKVAKVLGLIDDKKEAVDKKASKGGRLQNIPMIGSGGGGTSRTVNNAQTVNVQSAGNIDSGQAPRIGDIIASSLQSGARGG